MTDVSTPKVMIAFDDSILKSVSGPFHLPMPRLKPLVRSLDAWLVVQNFCKETGLHCLLLLDAGVWRLDLGRVFSVTRCSCRSTVKGEKEIKHHKTKWIKTFQNMICCHLFFHRCYSDDSLGSNCSINAPRSWMGQDVLQYPQSDVAPRASLEIKLFSPSVAVAHQYLGSSSGSLMFVQPEKVMPKRTSYVSIFVASV